VQHGFAIIPKSVSSKARQQENSEVFDFELSYEDMTLLDGLQDSLGTQGSTAYWNPVEDAPVELGDTSSRATGQEL
jgi:diketogulonate reductase-like aldo/keto reductase